MQRNAQSYVSKRANKADVAANIRDVFKAPDRQTAEFLLKRFVTNWQKPEPNLALWAEHNIPEGFNVFNLPRSTWRHLRTTNLIERMNQELKPRSRVVRIFPNEESCLRLLSAVALEMHEDWSTARRLFINEQAELIGSDSHFYRKMVA